MKSVITQNVDIGYVMAKTCHTAQLELAMFLHP
jgi:hypothetical protein